ncbi:MAG: ribosome-binding factor A [Oscillospiraceae bacterium]
MANFNLKRLSEDIKRELSAAVSGVKDPRVSKNFVTVTHCELTSDLSYARYTSRVSAARGEPQRPWRA